MTGYVGSPLGVVHLRLKFYYRALTTGHSPYFPWKSIWKANVPSKVGFFLFFILFFIYKHGQQLGQIFTTGNLWKSICLVTPGGVAHWLGILWDKLWNPNVLGSSNHACVHSLGAIGLGEFNCPLNYLRCTCRKLLAEGLCTPKISRGSALDTWCQSKKEKSICLVEWCFFFIFFFKY